MVNWGMHYKWGIGLGTFFKQSSTLPWAIGKEKIGKLLWPQPIKPYVRSAKLKYVILYMHMYINIMTSHEKKGKCKTK